jgi:hypothetical protein
MESAPSLNGRAQTLAALLIMSGVIGPQKMNTKTFANKEVLWHTRGDF